MTTFYDYELGYGRHGNWFYTLCAGGKKMPNGSYCHVSRQGESWVRKTCWRGAKGGVRYETYKTEDEALQAGIKWARRREQEDQREGAPVGKYRELTSEERGALQVFAAENGRTWKEKLSFEYWMKARIYRDRQGFEYPELQRLRNEFGPSWLVKFKLEA